MEPLFQEYMERGIKTYLRGDSGFSSPILYKTCEMNGCSYAIRLKQNSSLVALASDKDEDLYKAAKEDQISYAVTYGTPLLLQTWIWNPVRSSSFTVDVAKWKTLLRKVKVDLTLLLSAAVPK